MDRERPTGRSGARRLLWFVVFALALPVAGVVLVVLADAIPDRLVMDELYEATLDGSLDSEPYGVGYSGSRIDEFSECKRITVGLGAPPGTNTFESAVRSPTLGACPTAVPRIVGWAEGEGLIRSYDYYRYWNGSSVVFRPSIALFGLDGTRMIAAISLAASTVFAAREVARRVGWPAAAVLFAPVVAATDFVDLPGALLHALGMVAILLGVGLMLRFLGPGSSPTTIAWASFGAGAAFLFLADLTNPSAGWALTASSASLPAAGGAAAWRPVVLRTAAAAGGWIAGFAWMWFGKWVVAAMVIGYDEVRSNVRGQVELRLAGEESGVSTAMFEGLRRAWREWWAQPLTGLVVVGGVALVGVIAVRRGDLRRTWRLRLAMCLPALLPVLWFSLMRNHTYLHAWFVYRSLAVAFGIVLMAVAARLLQPSRELVAHLRRNEFTGSAAEGPALAHVPPPAHTRSRGSSEGGSR